MLWGCPAPGTAPGRHHRSPGGWRPSPLLVVYDCCIDYSGHSSGSSSLNYLTISVDKNPR